MRDKRANRPCSVLMLMGDALSSDEPGRVRLPGDAWYPGAVLGTVLSSPSHTSGMLRCGDQENASFHKFAEIKSSFSKKETAHSFSDSQRLK